MKTPLRYQATSADCGKTSLVNALMYLFEREEIPPQTVDFIARVTGDCNLGVRNYYRGTSANAMAFVAAWCNDYLVKAGMPIRCEFLKDNEVSMNKSSALVCGLNKGAVAVCGCFTGVDHYVLMTGIEEEPSTSAADSSHMRVRLFDPLYEPFPPQAFTCPEQGVVWVDDAPFSHNRLVDASVLDDPEACAYTLHARSGRDAVLLWRTDPAPFRWHA